MSDEQSGLVPFSHLQLETKLVQSAQGARNGFVLSSYWLTEIEAQDFWANHLAFCRKSKANEKVFD